MRLIFQAVIIAMAIALTALSYPFARDITARNIKTPTSLYTVPYAAQAGTVYISEHEQHIFYAIYGLTGACLVGQLLIYLRRKKA